MTAKEVWVVKILLEIGSVLFALLVVVCLWIDALRDDNYEPDRRRFHGVWQRIYDNRWLTMPEAVVSALLKAERRLGQFPFAIVEWFLDKWLTVSGVCSILTIVFYVALALVFLIGAWFYKIAGIACMMFVLVLVEVTLSRRSSKTRHCSATACLIPFGLCAGAIIGLGVSVRIPVHWATLLMFLLLPAYWVMLFGPLHIVLDIMMFSGMDAHKEEVISQHLMKHYPTAAMAVSVSFAISYLSFLIGYAAVPDAPVPQSIPMLLSNVICDGVTVLATLVILKWAVSRSSFLRLPVAIMVDVVVGAILACCSLYFGLVFSKNALRIPEVVNVLIGRSPSGSRFELGPYFWAMHTTFLPTALYLSLILVCWVGKAILYSAVWFFGVARTLRNPWKLTIAVLTLFSVVLGTLAYGAGAIEGHLKNKEKNTPLTMPMPLSGPRAADSAKQE